MTTSLKATKKATSAPSKAETIISDAVKVALVTVTSEAVIAYELYAKQQDASVAYESSEKKLTDSFYSWLVKSKPDYSTFQSVKKHVITAISESKGRNYVTIEKWFNTVVMRTIKALGYELPKAESKQAESMAKLRAELASIDNATLSKTIETLAKAGDKESLKKATQLASEKSKREKQALTSAKQSESKATTELKTMLKKWVSGMSAVELATLVYAKNNFNDVTKLAKVTK